MNLIVNKAKATYGPVGATSQRERPAGPRSPPGSWSFVRGHVCAAPTGGQKRRRLPQTGTTFFHGLPEKLLNLCHHMGYRSFRERTCSWGRSLLNALSVLHRKRQRQSASLVRLKPRHGDWQRAWRRPVRDTQRKWRNRKRGFVLASHIFPSCVAMNSDVSRTSLKCVWTCFYLECCVSGVDWSGEWSCL